jgi:hypothetical protein
MFLLSDSSQTDMGIARFVCLIEDLNYFQLGMLSSAKTSIKEYSGMIGEYDKYR